jgi:flagellar biosynthesis/type III secretory pathway protein FliH
MTSSSDLQRSSVLRGASTGTARPARISADLRTSPFVGRFSPDPRLVDPALEAVVAEAERRAADAGWQQGHRDGYDAGLREALAAAAEETRARREREAEAAATRDRQWSSVLEQLHAAAAGLDAREAPALHAIEREVAAMAVAIAEALVGRHLELATVPALDAVLRALALVPRQAAVTVRVHPDDAATLPDLSTALPGGHVVLVADPAVEVGGCVAEAGDRTVDARLGPALQRLREVLAS